MRAQDELQGGGEKEKVKEGLGRGDNIWAAGNITPEVLSEPKSKIEEVAQGLIYPTTMAFLGPDDLLVLEKEEGTVRRIINGVLLAEPVLQVVVPNNLETCMCGIAISKDIPAHTYVFVYFTGGKLTDPEDGSAGGNNLLANRLYRYEFTNNKLQNPKLLLELPPTRGPHHTGGAIMMGPDNNIYLPIGDLDNIEDKEYLDTKAQNIEDSKDADGRSGILRITVDGDPVANGSIIGEIYPLNLYYAYGIRNSFGLDFDPISGKLWDTENGHDYGDEINLVEPGFNSGWRKVQGIWKSNLNHTSNVIMVTPPGLISFDGKGKYSDPEFEWQQTVGPTALKFFDSDKLGKEYENDMFVSSVGKGTIYHFDLNKNRTELDLAGDLEDRIADTDEEVKNSGIIFGQGFGGITDIEVGPYDGYLYVISINDGKIFRIVPVIENVQQSR